MDNKELLLGLARAYSEEEGTFLLYSGGGFDSASKSILGLFPTQRYTGTLPNLKQILKPSDLPYFGWIDYEGNSYFQTCALVITLDHLTDQFHIRSDPNTHCPLPDQNSWPSFAKPPAVLKQTLKSILQPLDTLETYTQKIQKAKSYILNGDIYQVNLSQKMVLEGYWEPFELFYTLTKTNPAPFSAYIKTADRTIVSTSPERFLSKRKGILEARPIKGTAPRGKSSEEDLFNKESLLKSPKELAELLMITDLMRNDLARVSLPGSVDVKKLWHCEAYTNVFHLLSIINAETQEHPIDILQKCFPGGSITGCPKKRAMEVIQEIENDPRGLYTGSIGYIDGEDFDFNIAIRTLEINKSILAFRLGGGIVADSNPYDEYQETLHKGHSFFNALDL